MKSTKKRTRTVKAEAKRAADRAYQAKQRAAKKAAAAPVLKRKAAPAPKAKAAPAERAPRTSAPEVTPDVLKEIVKRHRAGESFNVIALDLDARGVEGILRPTKGRPKDVGGHVYKLFHDATGWTYGRATKGAAK